MKPPSRFLLSALLLLMAAPRPAASQADSCRGALDALTRVKEEITPRIDALSARGRERLQEMQSTLTRGTRVCKDIPELWFYLAVVSEKLGAKNDTNYAREKLEDFQTAGRWDPKREFDPFTMPPAAPRRQSVAGSISTSIASEPIGKKWALVVGIDEFADERAGRLDYAVKDSAAFAQFLTDPKGGRFNPKHVSYLANQSATIKAVREQLGRIRMLSKPDDLVVIYIASHGSARELDPKGMSYILAQDSDLDNPATLYSSSLEMIDLVQVLNREIQARSAILILDACYSGSALSSDAASSDAVPFSLAFDNLKLGHGRAVLTASRSDQRSWEVKNRGKDGGGYFTRYLLEVLQETQGEGNLSHVFSEVSARVSARVKADWNASQNPTFEFSDEASTIVLGVPEPVTQ
jgi:uncharacterized caspase-like protein